MKELIVYLLKSGVCLGFFLFVYELFLRHTTLFRFSRFYLLAGIVVAAILPSMPLTYEVIIPARVVPVIEAMPAATIAYAPVKEFDIWPLLSITYAVGAILLLLRTITAQMRLGSIVTRGRRTKHNGYTLIEKQNIRSPFSVWRYIFIGESETPHAEKEIILRHELAHIKQLHLIDLMLCELLLIAQWFNPLAWSMSPP